MQVISKSTVETVNYQFLVDSYEVERFKVLNAWSMFRDEDIPVRHRRSDAAQGTDSPRLLRRRRPARR